ncbi:MAG: 2-hydroxyacyl-CoA dehydratase family protein [Lachnospiraceae bacterium]
MLILDGDGIDRRNSHDGQIKTRLEAFLEMIQQEEESKAC